MNFIIPNLIPNMLATSCRSQENVLENSQNAAVKMTTIVTLVLTELSFAVICQLEQPNHIA